MYYFQGFLSVCEKRVYRDLKGNDTAIGCDNCLYQRNILSWCNILISVLVAKKNKDAMEWNVSCGMEKIVASKRFQLTQREIKTFGSCCSLHFNCQMHRPVSVMVFIQNDISTVYHFRMFLSGNIFWLKKTI